MNALSIFFSNAKDKARQQEIKRLKRKTKLARKRMLKESKKKSDRKESS